MLLNNQEAIGVIINIFNYRCFSGIHSATLDLSNGYTALVGINNSGKSSLIRIFYELRITLSRIASNDARGEEGLSPKRLSELPLPGGN